MKCYPLRKFLDFGINVTINTDDSAIVRTDIRSEFEYAAQLAHLSEEEIHQIKINAVNASFASGEDKDWMRRKLRIDQISRKSYN
jgi:adenosine deaminase